MDDPLFAHGFRYYSCKFLFPIIAELKLQMPEGPEQNKILLKMNLESELVFKFEIVLDWPPGEYNVYLNLMTNGQQPEDDKTFFVRGQIVTPVIQLTITQ